MSNAFGNHSTRDEIEMIVTSYRAEKLCPGECRPESLLIYGIKGIGKTSMLRSLLIPGSNISTWITPELITESNGLESALIAAAEGQERIKVIDDLCSIISEDAAEAETEEYLLMHVFIRDRIAHGDMVIAIVDDPVFYPRYVDKIWGFQYKIEVPIPVNAGRNWLAEEFWKDKIDERVSLETITKIFAGCTPDELADIYRFACIYEREKFGDTVCYENILNGAIKAFWDVSHKQSAASCSNDAGLVKIAVHEAGHIAVAELLKPGSVRISTIHHLQGCFTGHTKLYDSHDYPSSEQMEILVMFYLAGKAATKVVYDETDMTCRNDLDMATLLVHDFESAMCPYDFTLPPVPHPSTKLQDSIESTVSATLKDLYKKTCNLISKNRDLIDALVCSLMDSYTITQVEISEIFTESPFKKKWFLSAGRR